MDINDILLDILYCCSPLSVVNMNQVSNKWRYIFNQEYVINKLKQTLEIYGNVQNITLLMIKYYIYNTQGFDKFILEIRTNHKNAYNDIIIYLGTFTPIYRLKNIKLLCIEAIKFNNIELLKQMLETYTNEDLIRKLLIYCCECNHQHISNLILDLIDINQKNKK